MRLPRSTPETAMMRLFPCNNVLRSAVSKLPAAVTVGPAQWLMQGRREL